MTASDLLLEKAQRSIDAAERLLKEGDTDFAASRIYYAYFHVAQALLLTRRLQFSRHGQVLAQTLPINPKVVQELIEEGRRFLAAASRYLEELPGGAEGGGRGEEG